jgi:RNA-directed DNA polymerase
MTLDGLKEALGEEFLMTRYADDFIVLGKSEKDLRRKAIPIIQAFLEERSLALNLTKTKISSLEKGFEFLGFLFKEFPDENRAKGTKKGIFLVQPSPSKVKTFRAKLSAIVKEHKNQHVTALIIKLNRILRGWAEYYRASTATKCFNSISKHLFVIIWKMLKTRYRKVSRKEIFRRHFTKVGNLKWVFNGPPLSMLGNKREIDKVTLFQINYVKMKRHSLCAPLNNFDPKNYKYFEKRIARTSLLTVYTKRIQERLFASQKGLCLVCDSPILDYDEKAEIHHVIPRSRGGSDKFKNLRLVHKECHHQITYTKNPKLLAAFKDAKII